MKTFEQIFDDFEVLTREEESYNEFYMVGQGERGQGCDRLLPMPSEEESLYSTTTTIKVEEDESIQHFCPAEHSYDYSRSKKFLSLPLPKKRTKRIGKSKEEQEASVSSSPTLLVDLVSSKGRKSRKNPRQIEKNEEDVESAQKKMGQRLMKKAKRSAVRIKERRSVKRGVVESSEEEDEDTERACLTSSSETASKRGKIVKKEKDVGEWNYIVEGIVEDAVRSVTKDVIGADL